MKLCSKCKQSKPFNDFHKNGSKGLHSFCKPCYRESKVSYSLTKTDRAEYQHSRRNTPHARFLYTKNQAKKRKKEFNLTEQEYINCISGPCFYCQGPLPIGSSGVDRLDNSKGYVSGNIVPCCLTCNNLKNSTLTWQETLVAVKAIQEYRKRNEESEKTKTLRT